MISAYLFRVQGFAAVDARAIATHSRSNRPERRHGADDAQALKATTTSDFFAFDAGKYFDTASLLALVKAAHDRGAVYDWSVVDPKVELGCNMALLTYTNNGSLTEAGATRALSWLESATLVHDGQRWRIRFFHSTRVP